MQERVEARQWPIGTVREVREAGMDLKANAACCPGGKGAAVRGCPMWEDCRFHLKRNGGFKGRGPHNIGYFQKIDGVSKEDYEPCYLWVRNHQPLADQNIKGHVYAIVAQEGQEISFVRVYAVDGLNSNVTKNYAFKKEPVVMPVPKFPRPAERFEEEAIAREIEARRAAELARDHLAASGMGSPADVADEYLEAMEETQQEMLKVQAAIPKRLVPASAAEAEQVADAVADIDL